MISSSDSASLLAREAKHSVSRRSTSDSLVSRTVNNSRFSEVSFCNSVIRLNNNSVDWLANFTFEEATIFESLVSLVDVGVDVDVDLGGVEKSDIANDPNTKQTLPKTRVDKSILKVVLSIFKVVC